MSWNEAQASSVNRLSSTPWNVSYVGLNDIDAKSTMESTVFFQLGQTGTWKAWNLTNLTQKWVNGTATNNGVVLWATNETTNGYDLRFHSSDAQPPNVNPPVLEVIYSTEAATKTVYFLKDHLGSIRATVLDSAARPVRGYDDYDPWGYPLALRTKKTPYDSLQKIAKNKFTGKERDEDYGLNLDYFGARYYDWLTGRWISVDPLWLKHPDVSPYAYVLNNPLRLVDPDGMQVSAIEMRFLRDPALGGWQAYQNNLKTYQQGERVGAGIGAGVLAIGAAVATVPYVIGAALSNPVTTNEIGKAITEALAPGAENVTAGAASKVANIGDDVAGVAAKGLPALRQQYVDAVTELRSTIPAMREAGISSEQIARALHTERRALGEKFKNLTPSDMLEKIYERNLQRYGDRLGPSIEWLRKQGKSWEDIIESATRSGGKDLGF